MKKPTERQESILKHMGWNLDAIKASGITNKIYNSDTGAWTIVRFGKNYEFDTLKKAQEFVKTYEEKKTS